jgi:hypothetical protein
MKVKGTIRYKDALAHYTIKQESNNIFYASLDDYEGSLHNMPDTSLIITKGVRHWIGSSDNKVLIYLLGEMIDIHIQSAIFQDKQMDIISQDEFTDQ